MACELVKKALRNKEFIQLLDQEYRDPQFAYAQIHNDIFEIDTRIVITPNFDQIYDLYAQSTSKGTIDVKKYNDQTLIDSVRGRRPLILKIHGSIDATDSLIFSQEDYARARTQYHDFYSLLNSLIVTRRFLFLGAGLNDPDIKLLLENSAFRFQSRY